MMLLTTTIEGVVVREFFAKGECTWRYTSATETWAKYDDNDPLVWISIGVGDVPETVRANVIQALKN